MRPWTYIALMCGTSISPSPPRCSCPYLLLLMPRMNTPSTVHPLALSRAAGPYYQLPSLPTLLRSCGAAPWPVQVLGPPLAPSSSPALWSSSLIGRATEEHLKANSELSKKLYSPHNRKHPQIL